MRTMVKAAMGLIAAVGFAGISPGTFAQSSNVLTATKIACTVESAKRCGRDGKCVPEGTSSGPKDVMTIDFAAGRADKGEAIRNVQVHGNARHFDIGGQGDVKAVVTRAGRITVTQALAGGARIIAEGTCVVRS